MLTTREPPALGEGWHPLLCAPQDLVTPHNLLRKQKRPIVAFFGEAAVGTRKMLGAGFLQVILGAGREQNGSEVLPLPYVCRPRVAAVEEMVLFQQGALSLVLPSEDDCHSLESWRGRRGQGCEK